MANKYDLTNIAFSGGGVFGIAYLGVLSYLFESGIYKDLKKVAGTSAGALAAVVTSFNITNAEVKEIMDSLDYSKVPQSNADSDGTSISDFLKTQFELLVGDLDSVVRLVTKYGWYSTRYFYHWLQDTIEDQFDTSKKKPPYTFRDFANSSIHKGNRPFKDLYVVGTNISMNESKVFSYMTTPDMEVAQAVRISMSIPLFFESIKIGHKEGYLDMPFIFSDGGVMWNYPINIFDESYFGSEIVMGTNAQTFGARFESQTMYHKIENFIDFVENLVKSFTQIQDQLYMHNPADMNRTITINTGRISFIDFEIKPGGPKYNFLVNQGYLATKNFFQSLPTNPYYNMVNK